MGDRVAATTFGDRVEDLAKAAIDEEAKFHADAILLGQLEPRDYDRRVGMRLGLLKARELIDKAHADALKS